MNTPETKVYVGARATGRTTKLIEQILADNGDDLREVLVVVPNSVYSIHFRRALMDRGVDQHMLPVFFMHDEVVNRSQEWHEAFRAGGNPPVYVEEADQLLHRLVGTRAFGVTFWNGC